MIRKTSRTLSFVAAVVFTLFLGDGQSVAQTSSLAITTHHVDVGRTGWNAKETVLTPASVKTGGFGLLATVSLDEQVDAQPLYVSGQKIAGGVHNVVYVATNNNTLYAIDASSGQILLSRNLGPPVPMSILPGRCPNNSTNIGIHSTPVIDPATNTIYLIVYTLQSSAPVYWLYALDLSTFKEKTYARYITASGTLSDGSLYRFKATVSRQRSALLLANGHIYAGFASFCDLRADVSRGWVLGWQASTLTPLPKSMLEDTLKASPHTFFLAGIWMSGMGIAADPAGSLFFNTGNSDYSDTVPNPLDLSESVLKVSSDLGTLQSSFTPGNPTTGYAQLEALDHDFTAGGITVLPTQPGAFPNLAVSMGKAGVLYLLNRDALGGYQKGTDNVLWSQQIGQCWCGESYFQGADGVGRVVSSGGNVAMVWRLNTSSSAKPSLVHESSTPALTSGQDSGFFTAVSSNGTAASTQIIWSVTRPVSASPGTVTLYAFDPSTIQSGQMAQLYSGAAGTWPNSTSNANIVPLVANSRVYVASYKQLAIFGLGAAKAAAPAQIAAPLQAPHGHELWGTVTSVDGTSVILTLRHGKTVALDISAIPPGLAFIRFQPGNKVLVHGGYDAHGALKTESVERAKNSPALWGLDD
jgi:hypothetical protein